MLGRRVALLVDESRDPGSYDVTFDTGGLPTGIYFARIRTADFVETRPIMPAK